MQSTECYDKCLDLLLVLLFCEKEELFSKKDNCKIAITIAVVFTWQANGSTRNIPDRAASSHLSTLCCRVLSIHNL